MPDFDVFSLLDIKKRNKRSYGKRINGNFKRKHKTVLSLFDLNILLNSGRHQMLSNLASLSVSSLRKLDDEANKFYDRKHDLYEAALLTRCYTLLCYIALRPYIDSKINHIRHFIKIPFINKGIEFIDLPSIFRDNNVISAIPSYFENTESPIICYKYNKPIRNTILNFNKLVSGLDTETSSPDSSDFKDSKFCYQPAGHIVTGNLKIITYSRIRAVISKGHKYRSPAHIDFNKCRKTIASALNDYCTRWCKREHVESNALNNWKLKIIDERVLFYSNNLDLLPPKPKLSFRYLKQGIQEFHRKYVLAPADKAAKTLLLLCDDFIISIL